MHEYRVAFQLEDETVTITLDSPIDPASLILGDDYTYGEYEYVQECLTALEDRARREHDVVGLHEFSHVICPDGTVIQPT